MSGTDRSRGAAAGIVLAVVAAGVTALWLRFNVAPPEQARPFPHDLVYFFLPDLITLEQANVIASSAANQRSAAIVANLLRLPEMDQTVINANINALHAYHVVPDPHRDSHGRVMERGETITRLS